MRTVYSMQRYTQIHPNGIIPVADEILDLLGIFNDNYISVLYSLKESVSDNSDILDKIGSIYGLQRNLSVMVNNTKKQINLNDDEYLLYIKSQIVKNNFNGTYEQVREYYELCGLNIFIGEIASSAVCSLILIDNTGINAYTQNIKDLFLAGKFTIESMGISYSYSISDNLILTWSATDGTGGSGTWATGTNDYKWSI